jgi:O-acetyl-ADP-ribose deacetylase (regulator of RNase III)/uncharacterized protein YwgA
MKILNGNIFESDAEAIVNTVNTIGIMGKGIALQFKQQYPDMYKDYKKACESGEVVIGKMHVWKNPSMFGPHYIINFPTKEDWRNSSKIEFIQKGLLDLVSVIKELGLKSIAVPPLGCGNGGLDWDQVKTFIISALESIPNLDLFIFEPRESREIIKIKSSKERKLTPTRALLLKLWHQYFVLDYELTLLDIQKLCFFLQEFGNPLRLTYTKGLYGPYADNLRHLLIELEGHYILGFGDGTKIKPDSFIQILPHTMQEVDTYIQSQGDSMIESLVRLNRVEALIEGFETPFGLELLSTVYWVVVKDGININNEDKIIEKVQNWNPRKAQLMKPEKIKLAINRVKKFLPVPSA